MRRRFTRCSGALAARLLAIAIGLADCPACLAGLFLGVRGVGGGALVSAFGRHDTNRLSNGSAGLWGEKRLAPLASLLWEINHTPMGSVLQDKAMYGSESIYAYDFTLRWAFVEVPVAKGLKGVFFSDPSLLLYQRNLRRMHKGEYLHPWEPGERWEYVWLDEYHPLELGRTRWGYSSASACAALPACSPRMTSSWTARSLTWSLPSTGSTDGCMACA